MRDDDLVIMGFVRGAFGIRGWIKVHADTQHADSLFDYPVWWIGKENDWKPFTFKDGAVQPKNLVAQLQEVDDRDVAEAMRGLKIAVPKASLPPAEDGEYYWSDLIGMDVINGEGVCLGKVVDLMETGASDVLVVSGEHGQSLIPFVAAYVGEINTQLKRITVDWGLDY